jgi:hypothetical protein
LKHALAAASAGILTAAIAVAGAGCSGRPSPGPDPIPAAIPGQPCSQLGAAITHWLGQEGTCESGPDLRELLPIGDGLVLDWTDSTHVGRVWAVGPDTPLGSAPIASGGEAGFSPRTTLTPIGKRRVLLSQTDKPNVSIFTVNASAVPGGNVFLSTLGDSVLEEGSAGHGFVRLTDEYFLDYRTGSGVYIVHHVDESARDTAKVITGTEFHGTNTALRRGARIVNLGDGRLLEWVPLTGDFRVWAFALVPGRAEIFDDRPLANGHFSGLTRDHEIVVVAPDRILVWERSTGHLVLRVLDPGADNPLAGEIVGETTNASLRSPDWTAPATSAIENVVLVLQRGRSFDAYFGLYCKAAPGSAPTCTDGPACCEAMPPAIPGAAACAPLDPTIDDYEPHDDFDCLAAKTASADTFAQIPCGDPRDFACTPVGDAEAAVAFYRRAAAGGSLADRYFQSTLDGIEPNLIYLTKAAYGESILREWGLELTRMMAENRVPWGLYLGDADDTRGFPPPIFFDKHWDFFRGVDEIARDVELEQLPAISIVVAGDAQSERPGAGPAAAGIQFVASVADAIAASPRYQPRTLVLVTYLTSGGFFDHVPPPAPPSVALDTRRGEPVAYGPRVPLLALGRFARVNHVSHETLELSSVTKFLEWNWLAGETGQLGHRDVGVANIGSLLDAALTGTPVP